MGLDSDELLEEEQQEKAEDALAERMHGAAPPSSFLELHAVESDEDDADDKADDADDKPDADDVPDDADDVPPEDDEPFTDPDINVLGFNPKGKKPVLLEEYRENK